MRKNIEVDDPENNPSLHSLTRPFCYDMSCDCHEDSTFIVWLNADVEQGLLTPQEAENIFRRRNI